MLISFITKPTIPQWGAKTKVLWTVPYSISTYLRLPGQRGPYGAGPFSLPLPSIWGTGGPPGSPAPAPPGRAAGCSCAGGHTPSSRALPRHQPSWCQADKSQSCSMLVPCPAAGLIIRPALVLAFSFTGRKCFYFWVIPIWASTAPWHGYCHGEIVYPHFSWLAFFNLYSIPVLGTRSVQDNGSPYLSAGAALVLIYTPWKTQAILMQWPSVFAELLCICHKWNLMGCHPNIFIECLGLRMWPSKDLIVRQ